MNSKRNSDLVRSLPEFNPSTIGKHREVEVSRELPTAGSELEIVEEVASYKRLVEDLDNVFERLGAVGLRPPSKPIGMVQRELDKEFDVSTRVVNFISDIRPYCVKFERSTMRFPTRTSRCAERVSFSLSL